MILIDLQQVLISNLMQQVGSKPKTAIDENLIRHMVLNSLRATSRQFKHKYGDLVIACDNKNFWRKSAFPFYKSHRKKDREASPHDWHLIFETLHKIRDELKENFPYKVMDVDGAEADDIIGVLAPRLAAHEPVLILSSDKDFLQLQKFKGVDQYSPILKRFIKTDDPHKYVKEHIIRGDRGDGIPNFLSPDNSLASGERQKSISSKKLVEWISAEPETFCTTEVMRRGYARNRLLVDLSFIPDTIQESILKEYEVPKRGSKSKMLNYFIEKRLKLLIQSLDEF